MSNWFNCRLVVPTCVFLLLGAIINIAVAWGLALWLSLDPSGATGTSTSRDTYWGIAEPRESEAFRQYGCVFIARLKRTGAEQVYIEELNSLSGPPFVNRISPAEIFPDWAQPVLQFRRWPDSSRPWTGEEWYFFHSVADARGWPCLSMMGAVRYPRGGLYVYDEKNQRITLMEQHRWIYPISMPTLGVAGAYGELGQFRWLPLHPIWTGFAFNTVCYGFLLWLIYGGPRSVRHSHRLKRNRCPACGYPVGVSPVCTECGAPLADRAKS
ncbi:MAG: hypothetical protein IT430_09025 [Phycisphaerales bacterium]|nr:hypothetical protein [Phycisphaerales bacterium]